MDCQVKSERTLDFYLAFFLALIYGSIAATVAPVSS
jgi:hypothetical protein